MTEPHRRTRRIEWTAALAAVHAVVLWCSDLLLAGSVDPATWWPAAGVATAIVVWSQGRYWPAVVIGTAIGSLVTDAGVVSLLQTLPLLLVQAFGVLWWLRRSVGGGLPRVDANRDVGALISASIVAAIASSVAHSLVGVVLGTATPGDLLADIATSGTSSALGAFLVTALVLAFARPDSPRVSRYALRFTGAAVVLVLLAGAGFLTPWQWKGVTSLTIVIAVPVVIWASLCLGARATVVTGVLLAIIATTGTMLGLGALSAPERTVLQRELLANLYVFMSTSLSLTILAALAERERARQDEVESRRRLQMVLEHSTAALTLYQAVGEELVCVDINARTADALFSGDPRAARSAMIGRSRDEIAARLYTDTSSALMASALVREAIATRRPLTETLMLEGPDGVKTFDTTYTPVFDGNGLLSHLLAASHDVTERQNAATALAWSEARFRRMFESTVLGVFSWNDSGAITDANEAFLTMVGYTRADLAAGRLDWKLLTPPEYVELNELKHAEVRVVGHCTPFEKEYIRKDGGRITVMVASNLWAPGADEGFANVVDITSQRQAEKALRSITHGTSALTGEAFFHQLVRELHEALGADHVMVATLEGDPPSRAETIAFWSGKGYAAPSGHDLAGTPCENVSNGELCYYASGVARLFPRDAALVTLGAECYLGVPLIGSDGRPIGILAVLHGRPLDRPEWARAVLNVFAARAAAELQRLAALNLLRASEERLATVFDTVSDRLSLWSVDDVGIAHLVSVNRAGRQNVERHGDRIWSDGLIGGELSVVMGALFTRLPGAQAEDIERALDANRAALTTLLATAASTVHEETLPIANGLYATEVEMTPVFGDGGRITHVLRTAKDVTERLRAEAARSASEARERQSQKLEAIGTLAGGIAHDFNNILTGIIGNVELARGDLPDDHEAIGRLDEVVRAVHRARNVVRQIVTFSRYDDGQRQPTLMTDVLRDTFELLRASVPSSVTITTRVEAEQASVLADSGQLALVLLNLCTNSAHAVGQGGRIAISQSVVQLDASHPALKHGVTPGAFVCLTVEDNGIGMEESVLARIFDPYFTTKQQGQGTGLGLPVVHGIVRAHGGAILVSSQVGVGTRVDVYLPQLNVKTPVMRRSTISDLRGSGEHVLLVDDENAIIDVGQRLLRRLGYEVSAFVDPAAALSALEADPDSIDLVVTDLTMPGLTGLELARRVAQLRPDLPVILTTGYAAAHLDEVGNAPNIAEIMDKPFDRETFARTIRSALEREPAPRPL